MTSRISQALWVYLSQHWALPILALLALAGFPLLWSMSLANERLEKFPMFLSNSLGLPAMLTAFWVTSVAKWQFVNPRARLLPGFARAHVGVIIGWYAAALVVYPWVVAIGVLGFDPLASVAYALVCGALFSWGMHTMRQSFILPGLVAFFAPAIPVLAPFWTGAGGELLAIRLLVGALGLAGVVAWLSNLAGLTEESESYVIPTYAQSGKASRMEKSEARRNLALQLSRSGISGWVIDRWHDPLASAAAHDARDRQRLLRFGLAPVPAWLRCLWITTLMATIMAVNTVIMSNAGGGINAGYNLAPMAMFFAFFGPAMITQLLATRRPRMQTELLWPLSREQFVGGLFREASRDTILGGALAFLAIGLLALAFIPQHVSLERVVGFAFTIAAGLTAGLGIALLAALIDSGLKRTLLLLVGLYAVIAVQGASLYLLLNQGQAYAMAIMFAMFIGGWLINRFAYRRWLHAELG